MEKIIEAIKCAVIEEEKNTCSYVEDRVHHGRFVDRTTPISIGIINKIIIKWRDEDRDTFKFRLITETNQSNLTENDFIVDMTGITSQEYLVIAEEISKWFEERVKNIGNVNLYDYDVNFFMKVIPTTLSIYNGYSIDPSEIKKRIVLKDKKEKYKLNIKKYFIDKAFPELNIRYLVPELYNIMNLIFTEMYYEFEPDIIDGIVCKEVFVRSDSSYENEISSALFSVTYNTTHQENIDENKVELLCQLVLKIFKYGNEDDIERGIGCLEMLSQAGSKTAKSIIKFGTGNINQKYMETKTKHVICSANDINHEIKVKIKEENEASYKEVINFIIVLLENGFPKDYTLKFTTKDKTYIPVKGIQKTKSNIFWWKCVQYPQTHESVEKYIECATSSFSYYPDTYDEEEVSTGGFAAYALGLMDPYNTKVIEYITETDTEHSLSQTCFTKAYIEKFGINDETVDIVIDLIAHINTGDFYIDRTLFSENEHNIDRLINYIELNTEENYLAERLIDGIWRERSNLDDDIDNYSDSIHTKLNKLKSFIH